MAKNDTSALSTEENNAIRRAKKAAQRGGNSGTDTRRILARGTGQLKAADKARWMRDQGVQQQHVEQAVLAAMYVMKQGGKKPAIAFVNLDAQSPLSVAITRFYEIYVAARRDPKTNMGPLKVTALKAKRDHKMQVIDKVEPGVLELAIKYGKASLFWAAQQQHKPAPVATPAAA